MGYKTLFGYGQTFILIFISMASLMLVQCDRTKYPTAGSSKIIIKSVIATPPVISLGETCTIVVDAVDVNGSSLTYEWDPGLGEIIGSGPEVKFTALWCCLGASTRVLVGVINDRGSFKEDSVLVAVTT